MRTRSLLSETLILSILLVCPNLGHAAVTASVKPCPAAPGQVCHAGDRRLLVDIDSDNAYQRVLIAPANVRHVTTAGVDRADCSSGTTAGTAWRTLPAAMSCLSPGMKLQVHQGTYQIGALITLTSRSAGLATAPIIVEGAPGEARPILIATGTPVHGILRVDKNYWIFRNLVFDGNRSTAALIELGRNGASRISLHDSTVKNSSAGAAISITGSSIDVKGLTVTDTFKTTDNSTAQSCSKHADCSRDYVCTSDYKPVLDGNPAPKFCRGVADGHAINIGEPASKVTVRNSSFSNSTGDAIQCNNQSQSFDYSQIPASSPRDITISGNRMENSVDFVSKGENAVDLKNCLFVTLSRNKISGFFRSYSAGTTTTRSQGEGVGVHMGARNVLIADNDISNVCRGVVAGVVPAATGPDILSRDIAVRNNVFFGISGAAAGCSPVDDGLGVYFKRVEEVDVYNNTFHGMKTALRLGGGGYTYNGFDFWNNVVSTANADAVLVNVFPYSNAGPGAGGQNFEADFNHYSVSTLDSNAARFSCQSLGDFAAWKSDPLCLQGPVKEGNSKLAAPGFASLVANDFRLSPGAGDPAARAIDTGGAVDGLSYCGTAPDRGALEYCADWTRQDGNTQNEDEYGYGIAQGRAGEIFVSGFTEAQFDTSALPGGDKDALILRYDHSQGTRLWSRQLSPPAMTPTSELRSAGIAFDPKSEIAAMVGRTSWSLDANTDAGGEFDAFIAAYRRSDGSPAWKHSFGTSGEESANAVAASRDAFYVVGSTTGTLDASAPNASPGTPDAFIARYDQNGSRTWILQLGTSAADSATAVAVDDEGNVYVAGTTSGALVSGQHVGGEDFFVAKYDAGKNRQWIRQYGTLGHDRAMGLSVLGNVLGIAGSTDGVFASGVPATPRGVDVIAGRIDTGSGELSGRHQLVTSSDEQAHAIAVSARGALVVVGSTRGTLDGKPQGGGLDAFIAVLYPSMPAHVKTVRSTGDEEARGVSLDGDTAYVVGGTSGDLNGNKGLKDIFVHKYAMPLGL